MPGIIAAQDLVVNGDFASDLSGWEEPGPMIPVWSPADVDGLSSSGSVYAVNQEAGANTTDVVLRQCVTVSEPGTYLLKLAGLTPAGQAAGALIADFYVNTGASCNFVGGHIIGALTPVSNGDWGTADVPIRLTTDFMLPSGAATVTIVLSVRKTDAGGSVSGYFDAVSLARDTIFFDSFEP